MKTLLLSQLPVIHPEVTSQTFSWLYLAAFFTVIMVCLACGIRKKIPASQLLLTGAAFLLFFILGTKAFALSSWDWKVLLSGGGFPAHMNMTMLGGLAGLAIGMAVTRLWARPHRSILDILAVAMPAGMAIERIGCLLAGCCFGTPSDLPWAITYSSHSHAFLSQLASGALVPSAIQSLPVHPVQVYDMLCCLSIMVLVIITGKRLKAAGSRLLLAIILYGGFRFLLEFVRDPGSNFFFGTFGGIKYVQWMILAGLVLLIPVLLVRERRASSATEARPSRPVSALRSLSLSLFLFLVFLVTRDWFTFPEKMVLLSFLIPLMAMTSGELFRKATVPGFRLATILLLIFTGFLTSQTYIPTDPKEKVKYKEFSIGGAVGTFYTEFREVTSYQAWVYDGGGGCGGISSPSDSVLTTFYKYGKPYNYRHLSYMTGFDLSMKENFSEYRRLSVGAGIYLGQELNSLTDSSYTQTHFLFVINPSFSYDWRWFGIKAGFITGNFNFVTKTDPDISPTQEYYGQNTGEMNVFHFFPQVCLRVGPYDIAYLKVRLTDHFPQGNPVLPIMVGIGTGLGKTNGTQLEAGYSTSGYFADCYLPIKERYVVQGGVATNFLPGDDSRWAASAGFAYRFGYKTVDKKRP